MRSRCPTALSVYNTTDFQLLFTFLDCEGSTCQNMESVRIDLKNQVTEAETGTYTVLKVKLLSACKSQIWDRRFFVFHDPDHQINTWNLQKKKIMPVTQSILHNSMFSNSMFNNSIFNNSNISITRMITDLENKLRPQKWTNSVRPKKLYGASSTLNLLSVLNIFHKNSHSK